MKANSLAIEAAARAICRRRLKLNQERGQLPPLADALLEDAVNAAWTGYEEDATAALDAAFSVLRDPRNRSDCED